MYGTPADVISKVAFLLSSYLCLVVSSCSRVWVIMAITTLVTATCDRCGASSEGVEGFTSVRFSPAGMSTANLFGGDTDRGVLCSVCTQSLKEWLKGE